MAQVTEGAAVAAGLDTAALFRPLRVRGLALPNRIVMSPMTRHRSPGGVPAPEVAAYYRRRAEGGTGLVITEGTAIEHTVAVDDPDVPHMYGAAALAGWREVVEQVHAAGGRIIPQLWHVGPLWGAMSGVDDGAVSMRPSGNWGHLGKTTYTADYLDWATRPGAAMTERDIEDVIAAYVAAARNAVDVGFDGIALHGAHGYLLDSFLWASTNTRDDRWGGDLERRTAFPAAVVGAIRDAIGDDLPIVYRFSQHKQQDYGARLAATPEELGVVLGALVDAGADVLDASGRYFDRPAFEGSDLSLAGWAKKLTGATAMAVGGIGFPLSADEPTGPDNRDEVLRRLERDEFDLVGIGRMHLADPAVAMRARAGRPLAQFDRPVHELGPLH
ncbi:12-oxophytodienoate reductase [Rhodococcus kronopolitis]|uniref:12-oxophytodienoate reductase n=1 Tax=Rhodococcus kronopolitis TaxID=1460226 RepID=A0ABV9FXA4_9NOCA